MESCVVRRNKRINIASIARTPKGTSVTWATLRATSGASQSTANGVGLVQATCNGNTSQQWVTEAMGSGYFRVKSRFSGLCMDVNAASTADGASVIQWACGTGTNQQWKNF